MRLSEFKLFGVRLIENGSTETLEIHVVANGSGLERLTTAVYASAGTSHDFDELNVVCSVLYAAKELVCVSCTGSNCNLEFNVAELVLSKLDAFCSAYIVEFELFKRLSFDNFRSGTESSFHNTAGSAEDSACA